MVSSVHAQQYAGKFKQKTSISEFEQFIVMHDAIGASKEDVLSVKAFGRDGELWHSVAYLVSSMVMDEVISNFGKQIDLISVYKLEVRMHTEDLHYYLLGHRNAEGEEAFFVIEEYYHGLDELVPVEVHSFRSDKVTASY